jgi:hypothetical protein
MVENVLRVRLNDLPWELLGLVMDYSVRNQVYPILRGVNRQLNRLVAQRLRGLTIVKQEITQVMLFKVLAKAKPSAQLLAFKCKHFQHISPTVLEQHLIVFPKL